MEENRNGNGTVNIYDIARRSGVSIATVSRVINKKGNVTAKTKRLVESVIDETGYQPNVFARGLGLGTMKVVGVLCSTVMDLYYAKAVGTIESELRERGYDVILCCTGNIRQDKEKSMELLLSKHVDALILIGSVFKETTDDNSHIEKIAAKVPVVLINGLVDIENTYCVVCEEEKAMYEVVRGFVAAGRKDILYIEAPGTWSSISKMNGFRRGLSDSKIPYDPRRVVPAEKEIGAIEQAVREFLKLELPVSALCSSEDIFAVGGMKILLEKGLRVPEDVAVMGFNNSVICQCCTPPLSSVDNRVEELSREAVKTLLALFRGELPPRKNMVPYRFVLRDTVPAALFENH